jgi:hypothetical protein
MPYLLLYATWTRPVSGKYNLVKPCSTYVCMGGVQSYNAHFICPLRPRDGPSRLRPTATYACEAGGGWIVSGMPLGLWAGRQTSRL